MLRLSHRDHPATTMLRSKLLLLREYLTPINNTLNFAATGEISPDEFVAAGDFLVQKFPTWQWGHGPTLTTKLHLPQDKQFLVTKKVPLYQRATTFVGGAVCEDEDGMITILKPQQPEGEQAGSEVADLEELMNEDNDDFSDVEVVGNDDNLRNYDLYIHYLTLYRVPKLYLVGYTLLGIPLTPKQMYEDINSDYKDKTATIEKLPGIADTTLVLIHPCKHANVMKVLMQHTKGDQIRLDQYLVIFLKFIASVCPGIEYDYTMDAL